MSKLAEKVQQDLVEAIDNDDLVLPTLPEVALQIRRAAEDPDISVTTLSKVIGRDTALSARLIKVVNSPLLRSTQEVTDLHTAITRLGTNYSSNLAIGLVMEQIFNARSEHGSAFNRQFFSNGKLWLALLGVVQLAIPCALAVVCARSLKAPEVSLLALLEVIFGILLAWVWANEVPGDEVLRGGSLVIGALVINELLGWRSRAGTPRIQTVDQQPQ